MRAALFTLLKAFWGLCVFRLAPQDLPPSAALLALTATLNPVLSLCINRLTMPLPAALVDALLELAVVGGLSATLLVAFARAGRIRQTLTALMGSGALLGLIVLTALLILPPLPHWLQIAIVVWNLAVIGHILRHALDTGFIVAFFLAVSYALLLGLMRAAIHSPVS